MKAWQTIVVALGAYPFGVQYAVDVVRNWLGAHAPALRDSVDDLGYGWQLVAIGIGVATAFLANVSVPTVIGDRVHPGWLAKVVTGIVLGGIAAAHHNWQAKNSALKLAAGGAGRTPPAH